MGIETTADPADERAVLNDEESEAADLKARVEILREENRRLRKESRRVTQARYRQTALGLLAVGAVAALSGLLSPAARSVLLVLAGIGAFGAVLTYYLTPERFIAASVGERVYATYAANGDGLVEEFGLTDHRVYAPTGGSSVRLFVPQHRAFEVPAPSELKRVAVVPSERRQRGIAFEPTGEHLYRAFKQDGVTSDDDPGELVAALTDAVVEQFELASGASTDIDSDTGRATASVDASALGAVTRFDHPIASLLATGLAIELDQPVRLSVKDSEDGETDATVTCRWTTEDEQALADLPE